jgi:hypothetical protein
MHSGSVLHTEVLAGAAAAGWAAALLFLLTFVAARRPLTAGFLASVQIVTAWGFIASFAIGPAPMHLRWSTRPTSWISDARFDYGQAAGWVTGMPWELFGLVAGLFTWCLLWRSLRKRHAARKMAERVAAAIPPAPVIQVMPWPTQPAPRQGPR